MYVCMYVGLLANSPRVTQGYVLRLTEPRTHDSMWRILLHFTTQLDWHSPVSARILYPWGHTLDQTHTLTLRLSSLLESVFLSLLSRSPLTLWPVASCRLRAERAQTVLQTSAERLSAGPAQDQEGLQLWSHHAGQSPQHAAADGSGHVHQRDRAQRYWSLRKWSAINNQNILVWRSQAQTFFVAFSKTINHCLPVILKCVKLT